MTEPRPEHETREHRLKRMRMRSMRRGIKEMDIILSRFAEADLSRLSARELDLYDDLLSENDHDLYQWVAGRSAPPQAFCDLIERIARRGTAAN